MFNVVAIKQLYPGHAKQAGMLAANCHSGNYAGRWVIVVDDDIDPSNLFDVVWAMSTRCDPVEDIDYIRRCWSTPLDRMLKEPPFTPTARWSMRAARGRGKTSFRPSPRRARS